MCIFKKNEDISFLKSQILVSSFRRFKNDFHKGMYITLDMKSSK